VITIKGYYTACGYMGYVPELGKYILFPTESEYIDYITESPNGE